MDPVTSPLIHKDSGRRARVDPGEPNPSRKTRYFSFCRILFVYRIPLLRLFVGPLSCERSTPHLNSFLTNAVAATAYEILNFPYSRLDCC